jgi:hypothetical protein
VVKQFKSFDTTFLPGEELTYLREMHDIDIGCDVWIFATDESRLIEESLPEGGIVDGRYLWHERVRHKYVHGMDGFELPSSWLPHLQVLEFGTFTP